MTTEAGSRGGKTKVTLSFVVDTVSFVFGVDREKVLGGSRSKYESEARQWVCYVLSRAGLSTASISKKLGRDHSTVIYSLRRCHERLKTKEGRRVYDGITQHLLNPRLRDCA
jgi:chromosomal replication initiation ATPase DnaA